MVGKIWVICLILLFEIKYYLQGRHFTDFRKYASTGWTKNKISPYDNCHNYF